MCFVCGILSSPNVQGQIGSARTALGPGEKFPFLQDPDETKVHTAFHCPTQETSEADRSETIFLRETSTRLQNRDPTPGSASTCGCIRIAEIP
jgi:hypothetical protein